MGAMASADTPAALGALVGSYDAVTGDDFELQLVRQLTLESCALSEVLRSVPVIAKAVPAWCGLRETKRRSEGTMRVGESCVRGRAIHETVLFP